MRISTNMPNDDMQYYLRRKESLTNSMQNKIAKESKIENLRDDPVAAAHSAIFKSNISRMKQFVDNTGVIQSRGRLAEAYMQETLSILQRVNELAVSGANGTFTKEDTAIMGEEVNELLKELVQISNAKNGDGTTIFSGEKALSDAFRTISGYSEGSGKAVITSVEYTGNASYNNIEISENAYSESGFSGSSVFWAENQIVMSSRNSSSFFVEEDSSALIDGVQVDFKKGDNIYAVIAKINDSGAPVKASLDPVKNSLTISTTQPHQIWMEDLQGGTVLTETGILRDNTGKPPYNLATDVRHSGGSIFDMMIKLRDSLYTGNTIDIGGISLKGIQMGLNHFVSQIGELGAKDERYSLIQERLEYTIPEVIKMDMDEVGLDLAEAITELKMLEVSHKATLQVAARILPPTLLDFLR